MMTTSPESADRDMRLVETELDLSLDLSQQNLLSRVAEQIGQQLGTDGEPIRMGISLSEGSSLRTEVGLIEQSVDARCLNGSIFEYRQRGTVGGDAFNCALIVPTGVGAEIGGHAGDAGPVTRLLHLCCDTLITHPNVVNASDINELPDDALYVEGSTLARLMMGTVGLQRTRGNRVLAILDGETEEVFINAAINAIGGARATYGLKCADIVVMDKPLTMRAQYTSSGAAAGEVTGLENICAIMDRHKGEYDAVALASVIRVPENYHLDYFRSGGEMINPWGGVEAMITHALSLMYNIPVAHAPMFESMAVANADPGIVDPRMAAEAVSVTFIQCLLKGLISSPRLVTDRGMFGSANVLTAEDVSCLVQPNGCIGVPTLAALEQGITVIAVRENETRMHNDLESLPWRDGQFYLVGNYWEAAGLMQMLRTGMDPMCVRRPMTYTRVHDLRKSEIRATSENA